MVYSLCIQSVFQVCKCQSLCPVPLVPFTNKYRPRTFVWCILLLQHRSRSVPLCLGCKLVYSFKIKKFLINTPRMRVRDSTSHLRKVTRPVKDPRTKWLRFTGPLTHVTILSGDQDGNNISVFGPEDLEVLVKRSSRQSPSESNRRGSGGRLVVVGTLNSWPKDPMHYWSSYCKWSDLPVTSFPPVSFTERFFHDTPGEGPKWWDKRSGH